MLSVFLALFYRNWIFVIEQGNVDGYLKYRWVLMVLGLWLFGIINFPLFFRRILKVTFDHYWECSFWTFYTFDLREEFIWHFYLPNWDLGWTKGFHFWKWVTVLYWFESVPKVWFSVFSYVGFLRWSYEWKFLVFDWGNWTNLRDLKFCLVNLVNDACV